ncbi:hypothetical protein Fmac_029289 [Flemingia macrophylla]|uniref:Cytochrome b5 heme-binding domain-containing protein n=1 Tax=Flemingia macrophylla TaxID=520843 RepID=A0ABD1L9Y6_9FABA
MGNKSDKLAYDGCDSGQSVADQTLNDILWEKQYLVTFSAVSYLNHVFSYSNTISFLREQINTLEDAWISIDGAVYDVTEWLHRHPDDSLPFFTLARRDATDAFLAFHPPLGGPPVPAALEELPAPGWPHHGGAALRDPPAPGPLGGRRGPLGASLRARTLRCPDWVGLDPEWVDRARLWALQRDAESGGEPGGPDPLGQRALAGIGIGWWKWNHNAHHISRNSLDFDPDLQDCHSSLSRAPSSPP